MNEINGVIMKLADIDLIHLCHKSLQYQDDPLHTKVVGTFFFKAYGFLRTQDDGQIPNLRVHFSKFSPTNTSIMDPSNRAT